MSCLKVSPDTVSRLDTGCGSVLRHAGVLGTSSTLHRAVQQVNICANFHFVALLLSSLSNFLRFQEGFSFGQGNRPGLNMRKSCWQLLWHKD